MAKKQTLKTKNVIESAVKRMGSRPPNSLRLEEYQLRSADWDNYDDYADYPDAKPPTK